MKKKQNFLYHILFWSALYLLWIVIFRSYSVSVTRSVTIEFCYLVFITIDYYIISCFIIPAFLQKKKYVYFIFISLLLIAFSAFLRALAAEQMNKYIFHAFQPAGFSVLYFNSVVNILIWVQLILIGKMMLDRIQSQHKLDMLEKERIKNELDFLKAQINPHALFNSLNTIYGYIDRNNQIARNTLLQFSDLLRYQLYDCSVEKISLEEEVGYINKYISFHQLRKEKNLIVRLEVEQIEKGLTIVPLLLIVLIENAFKFVSASPGMENMITIRLRTENKVLRSYFSNTTDPQQVKGNESGGIGIANLKRRLELSYPGNYEFTSKKENSFYETSLIINLG